MVRCHDKTVRTMETFRIWRTTRGCKVSLEKNKISMTYRTKRKHMWKAEIGFSKIRLHTSASIFGTCGFTCGSLSRFAFFTKSCDISWDYLDELKLPKQNCIHLFINTYAWFFNLLGKSAGPITEYSDKIEWIRIFTHRFDFLQRLQEHRAWFLKIFYFLFSEKDFSDILNISSIRYSNKLWWYSAFYIRIAKICFRMKYTYLSNEETIPM